MSAIYKVYDPSGNAIVFQSISAIKNAMDLTKDDCRKIFYPGVHHVSTGDKVITHAD